MPSRVGDGGSLGLRVAVTQKNQTIVANRGNKVRDLLIRTPNEAKNITPVDTQATSQMFTAWIERELSPGSNSGALKMIAG